jgi:hypothetical protein
MPSLDEFKEALGQTAQEMSDEEVEQLNELCGKLAGALFDTWAKGLQ